MLCFNHEWVNDFSEPETWRLKCLHCDRSSAGVYLGRSGGNASDLTRPAWRNTWMANLSVFLSKPSPRTAISSDNTKGPYVCSTR